MNSTAKNLSERLYALRAGISVLVEENEKLKKLKEPLLNDFEFGYSKPDFDHPTFHSSVDKELNPLNIQIQQLISKKESLQSRIHNTKKELASLKRPSNASRIYFLLMCLSIIIIFTISSIIAYNNSSFIHLIPPTIVLVGMFLIHLPISYHYDGISPGILWIGLPIVSILSSLGLSIYICVLMGGFDFILLCTILLIISRFTLGTLWVWDYTPKAHKNYKNKLKQLNGLILSLEKELESIPERLEKLNEKAKPYQQIYNKEHSAYSKILYEKKEEHERELERLKIEHNNIVADKYSCALTTYKDTIKSIKTSSNNLFKTLKETTNDLLDFRDWENIDPIIYYLETGRADNVKEALQLLDTAKQNNMIIETMTNATKQISVTLEYGIKGLSDKISSMSYNLRKLNGSIIDITDNISLQNQSHNKMLEEMVSEQRLNNALQKKANCTSVELMKETNDLLFRMKHNLY
ncbi:MAG: hypothetical protein J6B16_02750 [Clostridia bacterium]|nr:hypothetical protein [Clostridia bacterium]